MPLLVLRFQRSDRVRTFVDASGRITKGPFTKVPGQATAYHEYYRFLVHRGEDGLLYLQDTGDPVGLALPGVTRTNMRARPPEVYQLVEPLPRVSVDASPEIIQDLTSAILKAHMLGMQVSFRDFVVRENGVLFIGPSYERKDGRYACPFVYDGHAPYLLLRRMAEYVPATSPLHSFFAGLSAPRPKHVFKQTRLTFPLPPPREAKPMEEPTPPVIP